MSVGARLSVLVCDDEPQIRRVLMIMLSEAGFEVTPTRTAAEALDGAAIRTPDAAIIDLMLPDGDGVEVCRGLRQWSELPILVLSAIDEDEQKILALNAGADDYVTKPFSPGELLARLEAALRRVDQSFDEASIAVGGLEIDLSARIVRSEGREVSLTPIEYGLLCALVRNHGRLMTHRALLLEVWGSGYEGAIDSLRFHLSNLRNKIEPPERREQYLHTERGAGYSFASLSKTTPGVPGSGRTFVRAENLES